MDEPMADLSALGFHALSRLAARHVTVALGQFPTSSTGIREAQGGRAPEVCSAPQLGACGATRSARFRGPRLARVASTAGALTPTKRPARNRVGSRTTTCGIVDPRSARRGRPDDDGEPDLASRSTEAGRCPGGDCSTGRATCSGRRHAHFTDRTSMAHSLVQSRTWTTDSWSTAPLPTRHKVRGSRPSSCSAGCTRDRRTALSTSGRSVSCSQATNAWLSRQLSGALGTYLLDPGARYVDFLDQPTVERLVHAHSARTEKQGSRLLLAILMLEIWLSVVTGFAPDRGLPPQACASSARGGETRADGCRQQLRCPEGPPDCHRVVARRRAVSVAFEQDCVREREVRETFDVGQPVRDWRAGHLSRSSSPIKALKFVFASKWAIATSLRFAFASHSPPSAAHQSVGPTSEVVLETDEVARVDVLTSTVLVEQSAARFIAPGRIRPGPSAHTTSALRRSSRASGRFETLDPFVGGNETLREMGVDDRQA